MSAVETQQWNPTQYAENARFVSDLGMPVVELLAPRAGESILDLGCGDGVLTRKLADLGCKVTGVDFSAEMVAVCQALGLEAQVASGEALTFDSEFDAVFSNAALHWMKNPQAVIAGVWRALKPGGRFVAEMGGYGNIAAIIGAIEDALAKRGLTIENPWYYPDVSTYRSLLEAQGFIVNSIALFPRPTPLPGDVGGWLETFAKHYLKHLPEEERTGFIAGIVETLRPALSDQDGNWTADYVRLRFCAYKPVTA